jgi:pimeloyl-ACP methyl ester carboxylesterase
MLRSSVFGSAVVLFSLIGWSDPAAADRLTDQIAAALGSAAQVVDSTAEWTWSRVDVNDEAIPIRVDILVTNGSDDRRALYMFPGSGVNFESNFFFPRDQNLAHFMRKRGYVVIGVNSRADSLPAGENGAFLANWGLAKLRDDAHRVITKVQTVLNDNYDLLGHSLGATQALDYAATYPGEPKKLMIVDTPGTYDPVADAGLAGQSETAFGDLQAVLTAPLPLYVVPLGAQLKATAEAASSGDASALALLGLALINTSGFVQLMAMFGHPELEILGPLQSLCAGTYDAQLGTFSLTQTPLPLVFDGFRAVRSGSVPTAQWRDAAAVHAGNKGFINDQPAYRIPFENIRAKINWVNTGLGYGNHPYTAQLIAASSHQPVFFSVVDGYGHDDAVYGRNAINDFWPLLVGN